MQSAVRLTTTRRFILASLVSHPFFCIELALMTCVEPSTLWITSWLRNDLLTSKLLHPIVICCAVTVVRVFIPRLSLRHSKKILTNQLSQRLYDFHHIAMQSVISALCKESYAMETAKQKAERVFADVSRKEPQRTTIVVGCDTIVVLDNQVLEKPQVCCAILVIKVYTQPFTASGRRGSYTNASTTV